MLERERKTEVITATIALLRKIRGFPMSLRIGDPAYTPAERQQFLLDAERIGLSCANLLLAPPDKGTMEDEERLWREDMDVLSPKYSSFPEIAVRRAYPEDTLVNIESMLAHLELPPREFHTLEEYILEKKATGLSVQDLYDNRLMIFSPLSTDYLKACLLHRFAMLYLTPVCFRVKPIILDRYLEPRAMPDISGDNTWITGVDRIEAFVEGNTSYETLTATQRAIWKFSRQSLS